MEPAASAISHDSIVDLRIDRSFIQADSRAARSAALHGFAEALVYVGLPRARFVLQRDQESAVVRLVVAVVFARPCVHVDHAVRRNHHVPRMANAVGKNRRAKTGRQLQPTVIVRARLARRSRSRLGMILG